MYRAVLGDGAATAGDSGHDRAAHAAAFPGYIRDGVRTGLLDPRLGDLFDLTGLAGALDPARDELLHYIGAVTLRNR